MPAPKDLKKLIDPKFNYFPGWDIEFGQFRYFYVAGYVELMTDLGLKPRGSEVDVIKKECKDIRRKVPEEWGAVFSLEDFKDDWDKMSPTQINHCVKMKPMKLPKAAMACICLERALRKKLGHDGDIYHLLQIRPALYRIDGLDAVFKQHIESENGISRDDLFRHTKQNKLALFREMADGYTVTHQTARLLLEFLKSNEGVIGSEAISKLHIETIDDRKDAPEKRPAKNEKIVFIRDAAETDGGDDTDDPGPGVSE